MASDRRADDEPSAPRPNWWGFGLVCVAYLSATVGEQLLAPVFPTAADDLGLTVAQGGVSFAVLTVAIAAANLVGGYWVGRVGPTRMIALSAAITAVGSVVAATAGSLPHLLVAQVLLGAGAGLFFPAGLQAVAVMAGPSRRGFAMGLYGVAFSAGLTVAALLGALGATAGWRVAFWISAGLAAAAVVATRGVHTEPTGAVGGRPPRQAVVGLPTAVGSVGAVCQYGAIPFLTTYAVNRWGLSAASAAFVLAAGRVISIVAKVVSGASVDRIGPQASARRTGLVLVATGLGWVLLPAGLPTYALAAVFAGTVSSLFPVANVLAVERFGQHGMALGAYRSTQIGVGALAGATIGLFGDSIGLRPVLGAAVCTPVLLVWLCPEPALTRRARPPRSGGRRRPRRPRPAEAPAPPAART